MSDAIFFIGGLIALAFFRPRPMDEAVDTWIEDYRGIDQGTPNYDQEYEQGYQGDDSSIKGDYGDYDYGGMSDFGHTREYDDNPVPIKPYSGNYDPHIYSGHST